MFLQKLTLGEFHFCILSIKCWLVLNTLSFVLWWTCLFFLVLIRLVKNHTFVYFTFLLWLFPLLETRYSNFDTFVKISLIFTHFSSLKIYLLLFVWTFSTTIQHFASFLINSSTLVVWWCLFRVIIHVIAESILTFLFPFWLHQKSVSVDLKRKIKLFLCKSTLLVVLLLQIILETT